MTRHIVITGIGVVTPIGIGREAFWQSLVEGKSGMARPTLFKTDEFRSQLVAEVQDFDAPSLLGRRGLQYLSRSMLLACAASKLALEDAGLAVTDENRSRIGVSFGTAHTGINTGSRFDQQALVEGPRYVNPMHFPTTGPSAAGCQVSITFGVEAFNTTFTNGQTSGLDAINYGLHFIRAGRADAVLAGGVEEACLETFLAHYLSESLARSQDGREEICAPFDLRRNGMTLGEGSAALLLEEYEAAKRRGATIYGEISGYGTAFDPLPANGYNPGAEGATTAMRSALADAKASLDEVDFICASANSGAASDRMEARAISNLFGREQPPVTALKSMLGEAYGASGAMQAAAAALALSHQIIPPTINTREPDPECSLSALVTVPQETRARRALINSFGWNGNNASLLLTR